MNECLIIGVVIVTENDGRITKNIPAFRLSTKGPHINRPDIDPGHLQPEAKE